MIKWKVVYITVKKITLLLSFNNSLPNNFHNFWLFEKKIPNWRNKSANTLALCHPPSASFCSVLAVQWSSCIFTHDRYNIPSDILIEFEVNLGIIIEKYA